MNNKAPKTLYKKPDAPQIIIDPIILLIGILIICFIFLIVGHVGASNYNLLLANTI